MHVCACSRGACSVTVGATGGADSERECGGDMVVVAAAGVACAWCVGVCSCSRLAFR